MADLNDVYQEWLNNPKFRKAFKKDPIAALDKWGYTLSKEELDKMIKFKDDNERLDDRISK